MHRNIIVGKRNQEYIVYMMEYNGWTYYGMTQDFQQRSESHIYQALRCLQFLASKTKAGPGYSPCHKKIASMLHVKSEKNRPSYNKRYVGAHLSFHLIACTLDKEEARQLEGLLLKISINDTHNLNHDKCCKY